MLLLHRIDLMSITRVEHPLHYQHRMWKGRLDASSSLCLCECVCACAPRHACVCALILLPHQSPFAPVRISRIVSVRHMTEWNTASVLAAKIVGLFSFCCSQVSCTQGLDICSGLWLIKRMLTWRITLAAYLLWIPTSQSVINGNVSLLLLLLCYFGMKWYFLPYLHDVIQDLIVIFFDYVASLSRFPICSNEQGHWFLYSEEINPLPGSALDKQQSTICHVDQKVPGSTGQDCRGRSEHLWLWRQEWPPEMGVQEWNHAGAQRPAALHWSQSRWYYCTLQDCRSQQPTDNPRHIQRRLFQDIQRCS